MLTLEAIAVLATIYLFFMHATIRATRGAAAEKENREVRQPSRLSKGPSVSTRASAERTKPA